MNASSSFGRCEVTALWPPALCYAPMLWGLAGRRTLDKATQYDTGASYKLPLQFLVNVARVLSFLSSSIRYLAVLEGTISRGCLLVGIS